MSKRVDPYEPFSGSVDLMARPMAAFAASSAIGLAMASQAYGMWLGAITGAAEAMRRAGVASRLDAAYRPNSPATARTRAAVDTLVEDARSTAREVVDATRREARKQADTVEKAVKGGAAAAKKATAAVAASALMPEDFVKPRALKKPASPDDLKAIAGIGPKLEEVLNGLGIWTYDQIAAWSEAEIAWVDDYLAFSGRIARDGWIDQAKAFGAKK